MPIFYEDSLLTNMYNKDRQLVEKAIQLYQDTNEIVLNDNAFDCLGSLIPGRFSVHTKTKDKDHSDFWELLDYLRKELEVPKQAYIPKLRDKLEIESINILENRVYCRVKNKPAYLIHFNLNEVVLLKD